jgi:predicted DNA-binding transcriptional regulator AlpA
MPYMSDIQLAARYGVSRSTIWRWMCSGRLPPPVQITPGTTRWLASEVDALDAQRLAQRAQPKQSTAA